MCLIEAQRATHKTSFDAGFKSMKILIKLKYKTLLRPVKPKIGELANISAFI